MTTTHIPENFQELLRPHLPFADAGSLAGTDELTALGLDSMGVVQLLADFEEGFGVELPDDILNEETFATVGSLWSALVTAGAAHTTGDADADAA